jgi:hypothetical protein
MNESVEKQFNEATGGLVHRASGWLLFIVLALILVSLSLASSYPLLAGMLGNLAGGLFTSVIVLLFYERQREAKEARKATAMTRLFVTRAGVVVNGMVDIFCEMHWSGSKARPTVASKFELLLGDQLHESIRDFNIMAPSLESSDVQYSRPWIDYLSDTLRRKIDALDRLYARYQIHLTEQLVENVEEVIACPFPEWLSDIRRLYGAEPGLSPTASIVTQLMISLTFPLSAPCTNLAHDVGVLAKRLNEYVPGTVPDEPWWVGNGQPPRSHGYAILPYAQKSASEQTK